MRRRCRWPATSPRSSARVRLKPAADRADGRARRAHAQRPGPVGAAASAARARRALGHGGGGPGQQRHVPRDLATAVGARADDPGHRAVGARHHGAGRGRRIACSSARVGGRGAGRPRRRARHRAAGRPARRRAAGRRPGRGAGRARPRCRPGHRHARSAGAGAAVRRRARHRRQRAARGVRRAGRARAGRRRDGLPLARRRCRGGDGRAAGRCAGCAGAGRSSGAPGRVAGGADGRSPSAATCTGWCRAAPPGCCTTAARGTERWSAPGCRGRCRSARRRRWGRRSSKASSPAAARCWCTTPSCST